MSKATTPEVRSQKSGVRKDTTFGGYPAFLDRLPEARVSVWDTIDDAPDLTFTSIRKNSALITISRRTSVWASEPFPSGTILIELDAAPSWAWQKGTEFQYEATLVPGTSRERWRLAWSIVRRLALAHPGRPALVEAWEWERAFDHVDLGDLYQRSWAHRGQHLPRWPKLPLYPLEEMGNRGLLLKQRADSCSLTPGLCGKGAV